MGKFDANCKTERAIEMSTANELVIQTNGLTKAFGPVQALNHLDLAVPKHAIVGFLGPNGAGKSTTIKLLLGLIRPTAGSGTVFGLDIARDSTEIRKRVGYLPQSPRFYDTMTAREVLRFTAHFFFNGPEHAIERRIDEMLDLVGLTGKADRPTKGFSGGERQRLGIAQAQINDPDLLILDEPAAALDPMGRMDVLRIMEQLRERTTIFYSTHILDDVQRVSDRAVILNHGKLVAQGPIESLLNGDDGIVYALSLVGDPSRAQARIEAQPWVSTVRSTRVNGHVQWRVSVTDEQAAQAQLLRLTLADEQIQVIEFGREKEELENVFIELVRKETNHAGEREL
jgi:ABC-2 type transport system ATP-binding protein